MANGLVTTNYMEALGKQIFYKDVMFNGLFPCQSSFVKMIELSKIEWKFNDKFEYRMRLSNTNSGGTINTQTFDRNFQLMHPGQLEYGIFRATYGTVMDGFTVDMNKQLETKEARASFNLEYAERLHSMRINVASMFKNFMIHGRYGTLFQVQAPLIQDDGKARYIVKKCAKHGDAAAQWGNVPYSANFSSGNGWNVGALNPGDHLRFEVPVNVFNSGFKNGKLLTLARLAPQMDANGAPTAVPEAADSGKYAPWGQAFVKDMFVVYDNQNRYLDLVYIGPAQTGFVLPYGSYFITANNRKVNKSVWDAWTLNANAGAASGMDPAYVNSGGSYNVENWTWTTSNSGMTNEMYTIATGAMEGTADLFPWYTVWGSTSPNQHETRMGLNMPYRAQPHRMRYTAEQAGQFVAQQPGQSVMNAIMMAIDIALSTCDWEDLVIFINPTTLSAIGMYEQMSSAAGSGLVQIKEINNDTKLIYQRGITGMSYRVGDRIIPNVVSDGNLPTDVVLICPTKDLSYNCWDNAAFELNQYIQDTFSGKKPPEPSKVSMPKELMTKIDLSSRIVYGAPTAADLTQVNLGDNFRNGFVHPSNSMPVAYHEEGALFTENPYAYTIVKLCAPIINLDDMCYKGWYESAGKTA